MEPMQFGHVGPHELLGPFSPFQHHPMPSRTGIPFGVMENGRPFFFHPYKWMKENLIGGMSIQLIGFRDTGKTTAAQVIAKRFSPLKATRDHRFRVAVDDTRRNAGIPEYAAFAATLGVEYTDLSAHRLNILDPKMNMNLVEQRSALVSTLSSVKHSDLTEPQRVALLTGLHVMNQEAPDEASTDVLQIIQSTLDINDYRQLQRANNNRTIDRISKDGASRASVNRLLDRMNREVNLTREEFRAANREVTDLLTLMHDELGEVFGGTNSIYDILREPAVVLDLTGLDEDTVPSVEMLLWQWRNAAIRGYNHDLMAHIEIHDENWKRWESEVYGRNMINHIKKIRGSGVMIIKIMHRPSDVYQVGSAGQRQQSLAISGIRETDIWLIGQTPEADLKDLQQYVRLPERYLKQLPYFEKGDFVVVIGERMKPFRIHLDITELEKQMTASNQALEDHLLSDEVNPYEITSY